MMKPVQSCCTEHKFYAHSFPGRGLDGWEPLSDHLANVAILAEQFAAKFHAGPWGYLLGLWHDLGKYSLEFDSYLRRAGGVEAHLEQLPGKVDHSTAGAQHASKLYPGLGVLLAYCIAGHHAGLLDRTAGQGRASLNDRLAKQTPRQLPDWSAAPVELLRALELPRPCLSIDGQDHSRAAFQLALFGRMLFSCLVDADFLATETFMSPETAQQRRWTSPTISQLRECLDCHLHQLAADPRESPMKRVRQQVLQSCRDAAMTEPGLFSLTVPTGGGKTLSSLAFGLAHAERNQFERVICAIPFTSITEQTAKEYCNVFASRGPNVVLEHHSNFDPDRETVQSRLAAQNWDAPVVVTTNVQLFESLFAAQTSRCRKLHRLVGSVIILDEAQTLPVELLRPCLAVLRELVADYHCSIVLCTATQPALDDRPRFSIGLKNVREIIANPQELYRTMKRTAVEFIGRRSDAELVAELTSLKSYLVIVNTRPHAARLHKLLRTQTQASDDIFHLSTLMCGEHRSEILEIIRDRLSADKACRVVSTQLIEAGVDIDFPVVYRALAGIDSIAQAAGRCNREGKRSVGNVFVFQPTDVRLQGYLRSTEKSAAEILPESQDLLDPETIRRYFELHYWKQEGDNRWDKNRVMDCFPSPPGKLQFQYRTASDAFQFIEDLGKPVIIPYREKGREIVDQLRAFGPTRDLLRRLQRYTVSIYEHNYNAMIGSDIELLDSGYAVLINTDCYDDRLGFRVDRAGYHDPESLIA
jgi:CRISPR-associated endonuclease/helicase Cas3